MTLRQVIQAHVVEQGKKTKNGEEAARSPRSRFNLLVVPYADASGRRWIDTPSALNLAAKVRRIHDHRTECSSATWSATRAGARRSSAAPLG